MQFYEKNKKLSPIYHRAICLAISKEFAHSQKGEVFVAKYQDSEQANPRRELLDVEQQANEEKTIEKHCEIQFNNDVNHKLLDKVFFQIAETLNDKEKLFTETLSIDISACGILEILSVKAASIKRLTPLLNDLPWLGDELINLVNKPQYRKRSAIQMSKPGLALSYIGLDNLKTVMPTFILKHWLPKTTSPFPLMKRKLWQDSLSIAMASKILAKNEGYDEYQAFTAGMLSNVGILSMSKIFTQIYNEVHQHELKEAYHNRDKRLHDVLNKIETTPEFLLELISMYSCKLTTEMIEFMQFNRLHITEAIFDLSFNDDRRKMGKLARILLKAKSYVLFRSLAKESLITTEESKHWLANVGLTAKEVTQLNRADIDHIKLNFN